MLELEIGAAKDIVEKVNKESIKKLFIKVPIITVKKVYFLAVYIIKDCYSSDKKFKIYP